MKTKTPVSTSPDKTLKDSSGRSNNVVPSKISFTIRTDVPFCFRFVFSCDEDYRSIVPQIDLSTTVVSGEKVLLSLFLARGALRLSHLRGKGLERFLIHLKKHSHSRVPSHHEVQGSFFSLGVEEDGHVVYWSFCSFPLFEGKYHSDEQRVCVKRLRRCSTNKDIKLS